MIQIEGNKENVYITAMEKQGAGYTGISGQLTKQELINLLINEDILEDGERVYFEEE
ncbi:hypothetical protein [Oceanobacillus sp. FSL H7-0719]|uniref:hypothetical protein n=1 Tax=Oceanobacillus sp. FSL H7-0719 TaxID=2954507 RepID=UPI003252B5A6